MELSKATLELLRDEAYVLLSRETLQETLKAAEIEKADLVSSRPPFGVLAVKKSRENFESHLRAAEETEAALRDRLTRVTRYETWLHRCIRRDLAPYLEAVSVEYRRVGQIKNLLNEWEKLVARPLPDNLVAFAREMRGLRQAVSAAGRVEHPGAHELALLREIAGRVEEQQDRLAQIANSINTLALEIGLVEVRVPPLPQFRRRAWVDWLCAVPLDQAVADVTRVEGEVRAFIHGGMQPILGRLQACRVSCAQRLENYLQQYWDQLRTHAQMHWVQERDIDQVLEIMAQRYDADIARRQREVTHNPFQSEGG
jgi:hypothetical protein